MEGATVSCDCASQGKPEWAFCEDDLFCPLCGRQIAWLRSTNQRPIDDPAATIWIYPQISDSNEPAYRIPLALHHSNHDRERRTCPPPLNLDLSRGPSNQWFTGALARTENPYLFELIRRNRPTESLPASGISRKLDLVNDFAVGTRRFALQICNQPQVEIELVGEGIEHANGEDYNVYLSGELTLSLTIASKQAPILVDVTMTDVIVSDVSSDSSEPSISAKLHTPLEAGTVISEYNPWTSQITLDTTRFKEREQTCELLFPLRVAVADLPEPVLKLHRIEKGVLDIDPRTLTVPVLYQGEICSNSRGESPEAARVIPKWTVTNTGGEKIGVLKPEVEDNALGRRITVEWAVDVDPEAQKPGHDGVVQLEPGSHAQLLVQVDCSERDEPFPAKEECVNVSLTDQRNRNNKFPCCIQFRGTEARKPWGHSLAIDFGNTHSYAATRQSGDPGDNLVVTPEAGILTVHDRCQPNVFPTAMFFEDISDRKNPKYVIGREALALGQDRPSALVTDLKRWIGNTGPNRERMVCDRNDKSPPVPFEIEKLVQLFLLGLIKRAEAVLRKYRIRSISLSYPAKFDPQKRASLERIIKGLCDEHDLANATLELAPGGLDIDEANAVAIGCLFDPNIRERDLKQIVSPVHPSVVVAAIDLGGGSLDTALLEFQFRDGQLTNEIHSRYLGIGGDDAFGGDIVTLAVMELLAAKIRQCLQEIGFADEWRRLVPWPSDRGNARGPQRRNFDALWTAAEAMKLFLCRPGRKLKDDSVDVPGEGSEAHRTLEQVLQSQLVDRLDLTRQAGRQVESLRGKIRESLARAIDDKSLIIDLQQVYSHPIERDFNGGGGYTVKERLESCLDELEGFCAPRRSSNGQARPGVDIDVLLLCGAGCGLPLVEQSVRARNGLQNCKVIHDPENAKRLVAFGIVRYLDVHDQHPFAKSRDYTSAALGLQEPGCFTFIEIVPACSEVQTPAEHYFPLIDHGGHPIPLNRHAVSGRLHLCRLVRSVPVCIGHFNLLAPPITAGDGVLPVGCPTTAELEGATGTLRLVGSEIDIELDVWIDGKLIGTWPLTPQTDPS